jgi:hypothetical protein
MGGGHGKDWRKEGIQRRPPGFVGVAAHRSSAFCHGTHLSPIQPKLKQNPNQKAHLQSETRMILFLLIVEFEQNPLLPHIHINWLNFV